MSPFTLEPDMNGEGLHIGIVRARFNEDIGLIELDTCLQELEALGVDERDIMVVTVPGALELGVTLARMAETFEFDALIALGAVIRGETYHFEIVSNESAAAISRAPSRSRSSRWKAMRCADFGPTPGRHRSASISRFSVGG